MHRDAPLTPIFMGDSEGRVRAVKRIAQHGMAARCGLQADLVHSACFQLDFKTGRSSEHRRILLGNLVGRLRGIHRTQSAVVEHGALRIGMNFSDKFRAALRLRNLPSYRSRFRLADRPCLRPMPNMFSRFRGARIAERACGPHGVSSSARSRRKRRDRADAANPNRSTPRRQRH